MRSDRELKKSLESIDHKGYPAYKSIQGQYQFDRYVLSIDHVQGDPFASPSQISIIVDGSYADIPLRCYDKKHKRIAVQDHILRRFGAEISKKSFCVKGSGKSGLLSVSHCGQEILERSACQIDDRNGTITIRVEIGFPANGRTIMARGLEKILFEILPQMINKTLLYQNMDKNKIEDVIRLAEDQLSIRTALKDKGLIAFVADGSILPRESGVSSRPLKNAVKFRSPISMKIRLDLPDGRNIQGMGIPSGITLIVGGGYHGKSTLLEALENGVYDHIAGDGREYVITDASAVKIRAEDGRSISGTDISMFINDLPNKIDTKDFVTENASGSTSQAANVIEALETGCSVLLIDEDTSATNFMIRDGLMQLVVTKDKEPITPYIDRIRELYQIYGISTILVAGSSGEYFGKADNVIQMDGYNAFDITEHAKKIEKEYVQKWKASDKDKNESMIEIPEFNRCILSHHEWIGDRTKIRVNGKDCLSIDRDDIDVRYLEQIVDHEQLRTIGHIMLYMNKYIYHKDKSLQDSVEELCERLQKNGFGGIIEGRYIPSGLAMPRKQEIFMCIDRFRRLKCNRLYKSMK